MTQDELAILAADCLERLDPGRQSFPLFRQLARLVVTSTVEIVPLVIRGYTVEVLLAKRSHDDAWWPDMWHLPGTVLLPTDGTSGVHDYDTPVERLIKEEFGSTIIKVGSVNVFDVQRRQTPRGSEQTVFAWVLVEHSGDVSRVHESRLFDVETIDEQLVGQNVIEGHLDTVRKAISSYRATLSDSNNLQNSNILL